MPTTYRKSALKWIIADIEKRDKASSKAKGEMTLDDMIKKGPQVPDYAINAK